MTETSPKVRILPESLINKIAAGEVVERPASVVKELVENAIDAGATDVQVTIKNGGKDLISVLDNGCGMSESDAQMAVERHATSKIVNEEDLFRIQTLGFRGEALASIASVSEFEILTCADENQGATRLFIKGGYLDHLGKIGFPKGTKITVERLFFNTPARLKFLKTTATELQHIQQHLIQKSLAYPHVHFRLNHNRQLLLNLPRGQNLETRIQQLFGEEFRDIIMPVEHQETYLQFSGFISLPSKTRTSRRWQYLFVNDRNVKSPAVNHGIYEGYGTFLGKGQHPVFFLNLQIDPTEIDVNVHPAKTEIRFRNSQLVHTILADQLSKIIKDSMERRFFGQEKPTTHTGFSKTGASGQFELPIEDKLVLENQAQANNFMPRKSRKKEARDLPPKGSLRAASSQRKADFQNDLSFKKAPSRSVPLHRSVEIPSTVSSQMSSPSPSQAPELIEQVRNLELLQPLPMIPKQIKIVGQFQSQFILAENEKGLLLLHQQRLHERLLYDCYAESTQSSKVKTRSFMTPMLLELTPQEAAVLEPYLESFTQAGFLLTPFGGNSFSISQIPQYLTESQCESVIKNILDQLSLFGKRSKVDEIQQHIWKTVSEAGALPDFQALTKTEMERLVAQWEEKKCSEFSIREEPIMIQFSKQEVEKRFGH